MKLNIVATAIAALVCIFDPNSFVAGFGCCAVYVGWKIELNKLATRSKAIHHE